MNLKRAGAVGACAFAVALAGCGSSSGSGGSGGGSGGGDGGSSKFCSTSASCAAGQTCHPTAKICVKQCSFGTNCTDEAKNCDLAVGAPTQSDGGPLAGSDGGTLLVCSCSTTALCSGSAGKAGDVCATYDKVCVAKCASNSDCPSGRTCTTSTGQCDAPTTGDAGTPDSGTPDAGGPCTWGSCTGGKICTFATGVCETPAACSTTADGGQPNTCSYGQFCSGTTCAEVARPTCDNFNATAGGKLAVWDGKTTMGPIIYTLTGLAGDNNPLSGNDFCNQADGGFRKTFTASLNAYNANSVFPLDNMSLTLGGLKYVTTAGNECDVTSCNGGALFRPSSGYTVSGDRKNITMKLSFCPPVQTLTTLPVGLYFTGGNEACVIIPD